MYLYDKNRITYFAETDRRNKRVPFGIKAEDRTRHMYIIGKTGMGKSTMIENMAVQDIKNGEGFAFIDPHGKSAALLLEYIPPERVKDVIYFAPFDMENPISFNIMEDIGPDKRHLVANGLMSVFKKIWVDAWSARMEYILSNVLLALLEYPDATLLGVNRMLADKIYRKKVVDNIKDPSVKSFWVDEYAKYSEKYAAEATPAIQNKIGQFTSNPLIRNIIGQPHSSFDLRKIMDERKILIVNLSKGQVGEGNANLLGSMIITKIYLSAMSRAELEESELRKLPNFYLYVDEFQSFANESFANILSEARKYKLALIMAHQYIEQMSEEVTAAVFGNVGTQVMFRVGATDAEHLEKEYAPVFTAEDMVNLGFTQIYLKLMIDGVASHPFSSVTMPPILPPAKSSKDEVIISSRELYTHPRQKVEENINAWYGSALENTTNVSSPQNGNTTPLSVRKENILSPQFSQKQNNESPARPFVAYRNENRGGERTTLPSQKYQPSAPSRPPTQAGAPIHPQPPKTEKPFAQAFKNLAKDATVMNVPRADVAQKEIPKELPLSALLKEKPVSTILPPKNLATSEQALKNSDNDNLNELKNALASILKEKKEKTETPPPLSPHKEKPRTEDPLFMEKEKEQGEPKIREVPEDVLTAILRGED